MSMFDLLQIAILANSAGWTGIAVLVVVVRRQHLRIKTLEEDLDQQAVADFDRASRDAALAAHRRKVLERL